MSALRPVDMVLITELFQADSDYVMDLSNRTFAEFFAREFDVGIDDPRYEAHGSSKMTLPPQQRGLRFEGSCARCSLRSG